MEIEITANITANQGIAYITESQSEQLLQKLELISRITGDFIDRNESSIWLQEKYVKIRTLSGEELVLTEIIRLYLFPNNDAKKIIFHIKLPFNELLNIEVNQSMEFQLKCEFLE